MDSKKGKGCVGLVEQYKIAEHITFRKEEIAELLPKRTAKYSLKHDICYLENICRTEHPIVCS